MDDNDIRASKTKFVIDLIKSTYAKTGDKAALEAMITRFIPIIGAPL